MKNITPTFFLAALLITTLWTACEPVQQQPNPIIPQPAKKDILVVGRVLQQDNDQHFGTFVYIPGSKNVSLTDNEGNFTIGGLEKGRTYILRAQAENFHDTQLTTFTITASPAQTTIELGEFQIAPAPRDQILQTIKNTNPQTGMILGKVLLENQKDNGRTIVTARKGNRAQFSATQADGSFLLSDLDPGIHQLEYARDGFQPYNRNIKIVSGKNLEPRSRRTQIDC